MLRSWLFILLHNFRDNSISFQIQIYLRWPLQPILFILKAEVENWQYFEPKVLFSTFLTNSTRSRIVFIHYMQGNTGDVAQEHRDNQPGQQEQEARLRHPCHVPGSLPPCTAHAYLSVHTCLPGLEDTQTLPSKTVTDSGTADTPTWEMFTQHLKWAL